MGPGLFFSTNLDLADILGDTDFGFEIFFGSQISRFPDRAWARLGPGLGWARLGWIWLRLGWAWAGLVSS